MGLIAAQKDLTGAISQAAEKVETLLAKKGIKPNAMRMQEDRRWLMQYGNRNFNIKYWSLAINIPKDGEQVATLNYFTIYKTQKLPPSCLGADTPVVVLQVTTRIPRKRC